MRWKLYGVPGWGSTLAECALAWVGIDFDFINVDGFDKPGPSREKLLAVNPLARVPTLVLPDGMVMTESAAIILHLADSHPAAGLAPQPDDQDRAAFLNRLLWFVSVVYPTFTYRDYPERWAPDAPDQLRKNVDLFRRSLWQQFETEIGSDPWILGDTPSALDLYVTVMTNWFPGRAWIEDHCPRLHAIALRAEALPALAPVMARNYPTS